MLQKILNTIFALTLSTIIYLSSNQLDISIFFLIILSTLNKNHFAYFSIIPLFFINSNLFLVFLAIEILLFTIDILTTNKKTKNFSILICILIFYTYLLLVNKENFNRVIITLFTLLPIIALDTFKRGINNEYIDEILLLCIVILNIPYVNIYLMLFLYTILMISLALLYLKPYYIFTSFFIVIYAIYISSNYIYIIFQISAYFCYFLRINLYKKDSYDNVEFLIDDINENVSKFLAFITNFSDSNFNREYEESLSISIKILIENYCAKCRNKNICYADKKMETYIFLKKLLTTKQPDIQHTAIHNFNCIFYPDICAKAKSLSKEYNLYEEHDLNDYKLEGVCLSIQNYFLSLFLKTTPKIMNILNFKKILIEKNITFTNFYHSILSEQKFQLKIQSKKTSALEEIKFLAIKYFDSKTTSIQIKDDYVLIFPKKTYKVIYDSATLSYNNCQISGDNFLFKNINNSNFICALSDGMGSGYNAYKLSEQTLKMVDKITDCNVDFETSLEILNNFFKLRDAQDSYATLDFVDIDLSTGELNLYKMGSSTTFILRDNCVVPIYNNNLPFGINELIIKEQYTLKDNDLVILVSDGVTDYIDEQLLIKYIETLKNEAPHKIVYEILQKIYYENNKQIKDDMSCVVLKLKYSNF